MSSHHIPTTIHFNSWLLLQRPLVRGRMIWALAIPVVGSGTISPGNGTGPARSRCGRDCDVDVLHLCSANPPSPVPGHEPLSQCLHLRQDAYKSTGTTDLGERASNAAPPPSQSLSPARQSARRPW